MTVSVEIHEKHDDTFFLGSQRYLQRYRHDEGFQARPTASSAQKTATSFQASAHTARRWAMREMRCHGNKPNPRAIETSKFAMDSHCTAPKWWRTINAVQLSLTWLCWKGGYSINIRVILTHQGSYSGTGRWSQC